MERAEVPARVFFAWRRATDPAHPDAEGGRRMREAVCDAMSRAEVRRVKAGRPSRRPIHLA
jgi:hypothetical protein